MDESETLTALRAQILALTYRCPKGDYVGDCPFGILRGLSHESRCGTLAKMARGELLALFDYSASCGCPADPRHASEHRQR